nr:hypothetical protein TetV2_00368 [Oceanusvirus sp.]
MTSSEMERVLSLMSNAVDQALRGNGGGRCIRGLRAWQMTMPFGETFGYDAVPIIVSDSKDVRVVPVVDDSRDPNTSVLDAVVEWANDIGTVARFLNEYPPNVTNVIWTLKNVADETYARLVVQEMMTYPSVFLRVWTSEGENVISRHLGIPVVARLLGILPLDCGTAAFLKKSLTEDACGACCARVRDVIPNKTGFCDDRCMRVHRREVERRSEHASDIDSTSDIDSDS